MMLSGLLWFDDDTRRPLPQKIAQAATRFRERVGYIPTVVEVNPKQATIATLVVTPDDADDVASLAGKRRGKRADKAPKGRAASGSIGAKRKTDRASVAGPAPSTPAEAATLRVEPNPNLRLNYFLVGVAAGEQAARAPEYAAEDAEDDALAQRAMAVPTGVRQPGARRAPTRIPKANPALQANAAPAHAPAVPKTTKGAKAPKVNVTNGASAVNGSAEVGAPTVLRRRAPQRTTKGGRTGESAPAAASASLVEPVAEATPHARPQVKSQARRRSSEVSASQEQPAQAPQAPQASLEVGASKRKRSAQAKKSGKESAGETAQVVVSVPQASAPRVSRRPARKRASADAPAPAAPAPAMPSKTTTEKTEKAPTPRATKRRGGGASAGQATPVAQSPAPESPAPEPQEPQAQKRRAGKATQAASAESAAKAELAPTPVATPAAVAPAKRRTARRATTVSSMGSITQAALPFGDEIVEMVAPERKRPARAARSGASIPSSQSPTPMPAAPRRRKTA